MADWTALIVPLTLAAFAIAVVVVLTPYVIKSKAAQVIDTPCNVCQRPINAVVRDLHRLDPQECGFVVRERPAVYGRPLAELCCPTCKSLHVYAIDRAPPEFILTNAINATARLNSCAQCRAPLERPPWPRGMFDGKIYESPKLHLKHGLICAHCTAVVCLECCQDASRGRTHDSALLCPRCFRVPIQKFHHF